MISDLKVLGQKMSGYGFRATVSFARIGQAEAVELMTETTYYIENEPCFCEITAEERDSAVVIGFI